MSEFATPKDLGSVIMDERLRSGVDMVFKLAEEKNIKVDKDIFIKGLEVGISLFIQKERRRG